MAKKRTHKEFLDIMKNIHPNLEVLSEYLNNNTKVLLQDELGIKYMSRPMDLTKGQVPSINSAIDKNLAFKLSSQQKHGANMFDYSKAHYITNDKKIELTCLKCDENFKVIARAHLYGNNCPNCGIEFSGFNKTKNRGKTIFKDIINIHGNKINLNKFLYTGMRNKTLFGCNINKKHGYWETTTDTIIQGSGCPICKSSKGEIKVLNFLNENDINNVRQKTFDNCKNKQVLHFDFYLPEYNTCIEFDGRQHFEVVDLFGGADGLMEVQERDEIKNKYCSDNGISLLRIPYTKFNYINDIISNFIKQKMAE